jgi:uncharacterized membrane protein YkoI
MTISRPRSSSFLAAGVAVLALTAAGCATADPPPPAAPATSAASSAAPTPSASTSPSVSTSPSASSSPSASASSSSTATDTSAALLAAGATALGEVDGTVSAIESERTGWEVHVVTANGGEQRLRISADGANVTSGPTDERPDTDDQAENQAYAKATVDYRQAVSIIADEVAGGTITELNLDREGSRLDWEADVDVDGTQRTVEVDAASGDVLSNRADD